MSDVNLGALVGQLRIDMGTVLSDVNKATKALLNCEKQMQATRRSALLVTRALDTLGRRATQSARQIGLTEASMYGLAERLVQFANTSGISASVAVDNFTRMKLGVRAQTTQMKADINSLRNAALLLRHAGKGRLLHGPGIFSGMDKQIPKIQAGLKEISSVMNRVATSSFVMATNFGIAAVAIGKFVVATTKAASDASELNNKFDVLFGDAAPTASKAIDDLSRRMAGFSKTELKQMASAFGGVLQNVGLTKAELADMSVKLASVATDIASFYNMSANEARDKLLSALSGEIEPGRMIGVLVDEKSVQALAKQQGIMQDELTQSVKTLLRYQIIMRDTKNVQGDFARTNGELANQFRLLQSDIGDIARTLGSVNDAAVAFLSRLRNAVAALKQYITQNQAAAQSFMRFATTLSVFLGLSGTVLIVVPLITQSINFLVNAIRIAIASSVVLNTAFDFMSTVLSRTGAAMVALKVKALGAALGLNVAAVATTKLVMRIAAGIAVTLKWAAIIAGFAIVVKNVAQTFEKSMQQLGYAIDFSSAWNALVAFVKRIADFAVSVVDSIGQFAGKIVDDLAAGLYLLYDLAKTLGNNLVEIFARAFVAAESLYRLIIDRTPSAFNAASAAIDDFNKALAGAFDWDSSAALARSRELTSNIIKDWGKIGTVTANWLEKELAIVGIFASEFGKESAKVFSGIAKDIKSMFDWGFGDSITKMFGNKDLETVFGGLKALVSGFGTALQDTFAEEAKVSMDGFDNTLRRVIDSTREYDEVMEKLGITTVGTSLKTKQYWDDIIELTKKAGNAQDTYVAAVMQAQIVMTAFDRAQMPSLQFADVDTTNKLMLQIQLYKNLANEAAKAGDAIAFENAITALDQLNSKTLVLNNNMQRLAQTGGQVFRGLTNGMANFARRGLDLANNVAQGFQNVADTFSSSFTDNIYDAMTGTITLQEAMRNLFADILKSLVKTAIQIATNYVLAMAMSKLFMTQLSTEAAILSGIWSPAAILASIATLGGAAAIGSSAVTAALTAGVATNTAITTAGAAGSIPGRATGMDYVPKTGVYRLHPGERVEPAYDAVKSRQSREGETSGPIVVGVLPESEILKVMQSQRGRNTIAAVFVDGQNRNTVMRKV